MRVLSTSWEIEHGMYRRSPRILLPPMMLVRLPTSVPFCMYAQKHLTLVCQTEIEVDVS